MKRRRRLTVFVMCAGCLLMAIPASAQTSVSQWLVLGPMPAPALSADADSTALPDGLLSFDATWPSAGDRVSWFNGQSYTWERRGADGGSLSLAGGNRTVAYVLAYLTADQWQKAAVDLSGDGDRRAWLDGKPVSGDVELEQGTHWLLIETRPDGGDWNVSASIQPSMHDARVSASIDPRRAPRLAELEALPSVTGIEADPMGRRGAFLIRQEDTANDRWTTRMEIRDLTDGRVIQELGLSEQAANPVWSRDGARLAFTTRTDQSGGAGSDIWIWDPEGRGARRILRNERGASSLQFSANGDWVYFTGTVRPDSAANTMTGAARLTDVWERWSFWKDKAQLRGVHVEQGTRVTLAGEADYSVVSPALSPDGGTFVYGREVRLTERPFLRVELWLLNAHTLESRKLIDLPREAFSAPSGYSWSPDGGSVAFCATAKNLINAEDPEFNVFESELYTVSLTQPRLVSLTSGSVPTPGALGCAPDWQRDGHIYVAVPSGSRNVVARTIAPITGTSANVGLETLPLPAGETVGPYDVANEALIVAVESPVAPQSVYRTSVSGGSSTVLFEPAATALQQMAMPAMQEWTFTDPDGWEIDGWYLTPPNFDVSRTYPVVVWYYGGTIATSRTFDRRLAAYAAQGYVVYVLNPAGAPGWGQEFSNLHTNDWGFPAGSDIIEGVTKFAEAHSFVDAERLGNFGHSYGGFMTMHMATRTDIFAASASIAGISNIAGYWGAGWTGYSYTDGTCPGCYPWNRHDVYVHRSPIFAADEIDTPMLLIHGTDDTNVVPTESEQMFTALRVLGKEAELIRFFGENHGVNSKPSVQHARDMVLFEWFDRYLRDRPEAWRARWGEASGPKSMDEATGR